ncbi:DUF7524 family protein [Halobellus salinus]|uniref:DUF7524 family protein n=1 Tax=Halobellus salinus TaxID=931585 RepID=UPI00166E5E62|nr:hypothetical protein [Halobellus salinus]SMP09032.1 hypothetical protein SAMN06265347_10369 [Halobellus salinus]
MSESLSVELNAGSVHAVDAPGAFTARGPFHLELSNTGGAVHVHVNLDEDLSRAARLREVNHYVETGETVRIPIGTVPGHGDVTGSLEVVSGYGAERERIEVTVATGDRTDERDGGGDRSGPQRKRGDGAAGDREPAARTATPSAEGRSPDHPMERSATGMGVRGLVNRSLPDVLTSVETTAREGAAFVVLAALAAVIGIAVGLTVGDPLLSLVVGVVVVSTVGVAGWLLLG